MTLATHIITGTVIGTKLNNPLAIASAAIVFHFLLDALPHGDYVNEKSTLRDWWKEAISLSIGLSVAFFSIAAHGIPEWAILKNILIAIFFSLLPDATHFMYRFMKMNFLRPIKNFHESLHYYPNGSPQREFRLKNEYWEIGIALISVLILLFLR
ncbi:MAG: hypothetical protein NT093_04070 [Candidatus Moranbacteria bacterium]|nr:hypothetical protein [Candidatus Moranbacteria bacterium]